MTHQVVLQVLLTTKRKLHFSIRSLYKHSTFVFMSTKPWLQARLSELVPRGNGEQARILGSDGSRKHIFRVDSKDGFSCKNRSISICLPPSSFSLPRPHWMVNSCNHLLKVLQQPWIYVFLLLSDHKPLPDGEPGGRNQATLGRPYSPSLYVSQDDSLNIQDLLYSTG